MPNAELAEQIVDVVNALNAGATDPATQFATAQVLRASSPPAIGRAPADIVVTTPAAMVGLLLADGGTVGAAYGASWSPGNFAQRVRHVVIDEADALLVSDSYWRPLQQVLDVRCRAFVALQESSSVAGPRSSRASTYLLGPTREP